MRSIKTSNFIDDLYLKSMYCIFMDLIIKSLEKILYSINRNVIFRFIIIIIIIIIYYY